MKQQASEIKCTPMYWRRTARSRINLVKERTESASEVTSLWRYTNMLIILLLYYERGGSLEWRRCVRIISDI